MSVFVDDLNKKKEFVMNIIREYAKSCVKHHKKDKAVFIAVTVTTIMMTVVVLMVAIVIQHFLDQPTLTDAEKNASDYEIYC